MQPNQNRSPATRIARMTALVALGAAVLLALPASAQSPPAVITVDFADDDMGFNVTSSKDISNVIVVLCDGSQHKHDGLDGHYFNHTEDQEVTGVYVKSGNNGIAGNDPPGAGQFFPNEGVDCSETTTSTSSTDTSTSSTETTTSSTDTTTTATNTTTVPDIPEEEVPFFGAPLTIGLGLVGAAGGALLMLRRRL